MLRLPFLLSVALTVLLCIAPPAHAALYTDAADLPTSTFDFVIVGAGAGGAVMAARLSENPSTSVLVIEAGPSDAGLLEIAVPFMAPELTGPFSKWTWNFTTVPQAELNNRTLAYARGRILGGSTSVNYMAHTRGSDDEYNLWAQLTGDEGWAWSNLEKFYFKSARLVAASNGRSSTGLVNPLAHGFGPVEVSLPGHTEPIDDRILQTARTVPEFPLAADLNAGRNIGMALMQSSVSGGRRVSSATAYLHPAISRPNLHVLIGNTVTKLVQTGNTTRGPEFKQVEFAPNSTAPCTSVKATKEIILSAGTISTPQILMLSGVGNATELSSFGITPVVDLPDVGRNLQDQPLLASYFRVISNISNATYDAVERSPELKTAALAQWNATRTGLFSGGVVNGVGFLRLPANSSIFQNITDPAAGPNTGHIEMIFGDGYNALVDPQPATGNFLTVQLSVSTPTSLGSVTLNNTDPFTFPVIDPNFLGTPFDRFAVVEVVKAARRFVSAPTWDGFIGDRFGVIGDADTDEEILDACRKEVVTIWHPTSTARMAARDVPWGVVDPDLLVKGVSGLRIVDASVFPRIPAVHPSAVIYIMAERVADLIQNVGTRAVRDEL
ncbi:aryl-alcohol oxidase-like protein [Phanerochaete sordida]|uniref:Aryl-alcohol oxidase-like protein n=1 Tax=Phanerochaete sordida TaxID=48140 RepID=A0A9P3LNK5_9APHY|nr:aryl-alcohol oxidase-like protein [Phanerochaete sordida]